MTTKTKGTRRDVLKAGTVALGAVLLPRTAGATEGGAFDALRAAHLRDLESFAEELRPRFESGELRGYRDEDDDRDGDEHPSNRLEALVAKRFGLVVTEAEDGFGGLAYGGDSTAAYLILAMSPHAESTMDGYFHAGYHAQAAVAWDVIALARARRWYTPAPDETEDPALQAWCEECGHGASFHGDGDGVKAGCRVFGCDCTARHARHAPGFVP